VTLPPALRAALEETLGAPVDRAQPVMGGDINQAARLEIGGTACFLKWHVRAPEGMLRAEAEGLRLLAQADAVRVPQVIAQGEVDGTGYLLLEYIEQQGHRGSGDVMASFGEQLAALHRHTAQTHGLESDNFIGRLPQPNTPSTSWTAFYRDQRLGVQIDLARRLGRLPAHRADRMARLLDRLPALLDDAAMPPSLLHGDLWGGNYLIDAQGRAVLIDPAVYYGHCEMDLAMTELFGGFGARFYEAYHAAYPLEGYPERRALYQLYYILVHLNHFGEPYGAQADALAARYVG